MLVSEFLLDLDHIGKADQTLVSSPSRERVMLQWPKAPRVRATFLVGSTLCAVTRLCWEDLVLPLVPLGQDNRKLCTGTLLGSVVSSLILICVL